MQGQAGERYRGDATQSQVPGIRRRFLPHRFVDLIGCNPGTSPQQDAGYRQSPEA